VAGLRTERHNDRPSSMASGNGSSQTTSPSRVGLGGSTLGTSHSLAWRRLAARRTLRHRFVPIRYSQVQSEARPWNLARPCQAVSSVSLGRVLSIGRIRASGSNAPVALGGTARSAPGTRRCPRPWPWTSGRKLPPSVSPSSPSSRHCYLVWTPTHGANWAAPRRPVSRYRGVYISGLTSQ
jgi:hypothetical protein